MYFYIKSILGKIFNNFVTPTDTRFYYLSLILENDKWSIHGLWPQNNKTDYPQFCRAVTFDISLLDPIMTDLQQNWSSDRGPDSTFWEHEWKKHGSCMFNDSNEFDYFNTTLKLFHLVNKEGVINNYKKGTIALIPFDLNLNIIRSL